MSHSPTTRLVVAALVMQSLAIRVSRGDDATARYFDGLRERGLFQVAESYCLERLSYARLPPAQRAEWTIELSRTLCEHARNSASDEQPPLWKRADDVLLDLLKREPSHPRRLALEAQSAFVVTSQAEFLFAQAEVSPEDPELRERAIATSQAALQRIRAVEKSAAATAAKLRNEGSGTDGGMSGPEARSLLETLRYTLAGTLVGQARIAEKASPDRMSAVLDAEELLKRLAGGIPGEELTWNSRVLLAECARLKGDERQTEALVAGLEKDNPPPSVANRVVAVRARAELDAGRPDEAAALISRHHRKTQGLSGELHYLKAVAVAGMIEIAQQKRDETLADDLRKQLESQVEAAEGAVGGWWGYRCRLVVEHVREGKEYGRELAPIVRRARSAWSAGRTEEAISLYETARELAGKSGKESVVVELAFAQGSLLLQSGQLAPASEAFRSIAVDYPKNARAADAHLMWAYCLGREYEGGRTQERREAYTAALEEHRNRFAGQATAHEATWMLAGLQERRLQNTQAFRLYDTIPAEHRRGLEAQIAVARCLEAIFVRLRELKQPAAEWERAALDRLDRTRSTFPDEPSPLSREQAEAALRFARLCLALARPDYVRADAMLAQVLANEVPAASSDPGPEPSTAKDSTAGSQAETLRGIRRTAMQLRIVSLAGQQRWAQANELIERLADANPTEVLAVLNGLTTAGDGLDEATRRSLADMQLKTAERLSSRRDALSDDQKRQLDLCVAQALVASHQPRKAAAAYETLVKKSPRDVGLRRAYAETLIAAGTREHLVKARSEWRTIEGALKPGEPAWLEARLNVASCALALGDAEECRKLLKVTRVLYPDLGGADLAEKFRELEQRANRTR